MGLLSGLYRHRRWTPLRLNPTAFLDARYGVTAKVPVADFDGSADFMSHADAASLSFAADATIGCWFLTDTTSGNHGLISKWGGTNNEYSLYISGTRVKFDAHSTGGTLGIPEHTATSNGTITTATWYLAVARNVDGVEISVELDREASPSATAHVGGLYSGSNTFHVGAIGGSSLHNGRVGFAFMADSLLSDDVLDEIYAAGPSGLYSELSSTSQAALTHAWDMNEHSTAASAVTRVASVGGMNLTDNNNTPSVQGPRDAVAAGVQGMVSQWDDVRGSGVASFVQATAANQPLWKPTGGPTGGPSVVFDASDELVAGATLISKSLPFSLFALTKAGASPSDAQIFTTVTTINGDIFRYRNNGGTAEARFYGGSASTDGVYGAAQTDWAVNSCVTASTGGVAGTTTLRRNGTSLVSASQTRSNTAAEHNATLGNATTAIHYSALVLTTTVLSNADQNRLGRWMAQRELGGVPWSAVA